MPTVLSDMVQVYICRPAHGPGYEFLLLQRSVDDELYPGIWQIITGTLETNECASAGALREVLEETGIRAGELVTVPYVAVYFSDETDTIHLIPSFAAILTDAPDVMLSEEHQSFEWLEYGHALERLPIPAHREGLRILKENILN